MDRQVHGRRLVYLDNAATSQKPRQVMEAVEDFYCQHNANIHRGLHVLAEEATAAYEDVRRKVAGFVGAPDPRGVVFTRGTTESTNLVAYAWARRRLKAGDSIVSTLMEHHSNIVPWQMAAADVGAEMRYIGVTPDGYLDLADLPIDATTKLVCVTAMSNVLGTINDLGPIIEAARAVGALVVIDGAQIVPHAPTSFEDLGGDVLVFSGHKMLGPTGIGCLVARPELLEQMDPFMGGGEMISDVTLDGATWNDVPWKFEGGTMMIAQAVGLGAAIDYLEALGMSAVRDHEIELARHGLKVLGEVPGCKVYGPTDPDHRGATLAFNVFSADGELVHPHDVAQILDTEGVAVRASHHCAKPLHRHYDLAASCRASAYVYNTTEELDILAEAVVKARDFFLGGPEG